MLLRPKNSRGFTHIYGVCWWGGQMPTQLKLHELLRAGHWLIPVSQTHFPSIHPRPLLGDRNWREGDLRVWSSCSHFLGALMKKYLPRCCYTQNDWKMFQQGKYQVYLSTLWTSNFWTVDTMSPQFNPRALRRLQRWQHHSTGPLQMPAIYQAHQALVLPNPSPSAGEQWLAADTLSIPVYGESQWQWNHILGVCKLRVIFCICSYVNAQKLANRPTKCSHTPTK